MKITLNNEYQQLYCGDITDLSPLGFAIEVGLSESDRFRDNTGRFICFDIELDLFPGSADDAVTGKAMVQSVRRISQQQNSLMIRFMDLEQGAYRAIAESLSASAAIEYAQQEDSSEPDFPQQLAG